MSSIKTMADFIPLFPPGSVIQDRSNEWHSPCPFCYADNNSREIVFNNVHFYGHDRLVWRGGGVWCRRCAEMGRGNTGNGSYRFDVLAQKLSADVDDAFDAELNAIIEEEPLRMLWTEGMVQRAHERVDRNFWYKFGWTDDVINRFKLGKGTLYGADGEVNIIPMQVTHISDEEENHAIAGLYYLAGRKQGLPPKRSPGSIRSYFWKICRENEQAPPSLAIICEGEKDGITASTLFADADVFVSYGAAAWTKQKTEALYRMGYKTFWFFGDNDLAGQLMSHNGALWATGLGAESYTLAWEDMFPLKFDVTDLLQNHQYEYTLAYIQNHMVLNTDHGDAGVTRAVYLSDVNSLVDYSQLEFIELEDLRGEGENSLSYKIHEFLSSYEDKKLRNRGVLQLLQAPPGAGKTFTLIKIAEEIAQQEFSVRVAERQALEQTLEEVRNEIIQETDVDVKAQLQESLVKIQNQLTNFTFSSVAWYGQYKDGYNDLLATGANEDLWFNFEARNPENCVNFDTVTKLAANNHDVGSYCNLVCPFKRECSRSGYLSQDTERRKKPITFFRFQHMGNHHRAAEYTKLNVVDENPGGLVDNTPVIFQASDVYPFNDGWELDIEDRTTSRMIDLLTSGVRAAMNENIGQDTIISGAQFLKLVDNNISGTTNGEYSLQQVMENVNETLLTNYYQPTFLGGDIEQVRKRCVPQLFTTILRELSDYVENNNHHYPSCIHLVNGCLELYAQQILKFSSSVPIIVADATALPLLYDALFKREVEVYAPRIRNKNAEIVVVHGSDWTKSQISKEIGRQIVRAKMDDLDESIYDKRIVRDAITIITGLAQRHTSLLVVTHKNIRELFEKLMEGKLDNISWGHYGALRGSNAYADYEAVVLIGAFRVPYDIMYRRISAWAWLLGLRDELTRETVIKPMAYEGQGTGHGYRSFENWFADAYVNMVEQGEIIQSAERIRPHSSTQKKYVYVVASRPAATYVTDVVSKNEFMKQFLETKEKELYKYMLDYYNQYKDFPSYRGTVERFSTSNSVISKIKQKIQGEFQ